MPESGEPLTKCRKLCLSFSRRAKEPFYMQATVLYFSPQDYIVYRTVIYIMELAARLMCSCPATKFVTVYVYI